MTATKHLLNMKKVTFSSRSRKPPNPYPTLTWRHCEPGLGMLWRGTDEEVFFNPSLKFAPTGSRTQDLGSCH
jgi:hypothetical protein